MLRGVLDDAVVIELGEQLLADPQSVRELSDDAIGALLYQGLLEAPPGVDRSQAELGGGSVIKVWSCDRFPRLPALNSSLETLHPAAAAEHRGSAAPWARAHGVAPSPSATT